MRSYEELTASLDRGHSVRVHREVVTDPARLRVLMDVPTLPGDDPATGIYLSEIERLRAENEALRLRMTGAPTTGGEIVDHGWNETNLTPEERRESRAAALEGASYQELKAHAKSLGLETTGGAEELRARILAAEFRSEA